MNAATETLPRCIFCDKMHDHREPCQRKAEGITDALPWEDMDPDVLECGDPQATHALYVKMLRSRAAQARKIAHEQKQAAADCLEGAQTFAAHALDFDALANALEKAPVTFAAQADRNPEGHDPAEGHGRNDESPVGEADAPERCSEHSIHSSSGRG